MHLPPIPIEQFLARPFHLFDQTWLLLTCGDFSAHDFNTMTISWGSLGAMWNRPFAQVVVRPTRHTYQFMERYETFTLAAFPEACRPALQLLGSKSGREGDKIAEAGLTPVAARHVPAPAFAEAELVIECRKIYWDDFDPARFLDPAINRLYRDDYHRIYYGEILAVSGVETYRNR
ncbi:MAG: flavin reductase family protein [Chloroflexi bacterium]|nr:flavin reductase family protein [Chloroflexota bacterium]